MNLLIGDDRSLFPFNSRSHRFGGQAQIPVGPALGDQTLISGFGHIDLFVE